jgi:hypothetical protein
MMDTEDILVEINRLIAAEERDTREREWQRFYERTSRLRAQHETRLRSWRKSIPRDEAVTPQELSVIIAEGIAAQDIETDNQI